MARPYSFYKQTIENRKRWLLEDITNKLDELFVSVSEDGEEYKLVLKDTVYDHEDDSQGYDNVFKDSAGYFITPESDEWNNDLKHIPFDTMLEIYRVLELGEYQFKKVEDE